MTNLRLENITKIFDGLVAVDDVTLTVPEGQLFSLLGPSGCGKTTLMRIIAGLETPTKGRVYFGDKNVTGLSPEQRNVAMVFQTPAVYPTKNVFENLEFPLKVRGVEEGEREPRVEEVAELVGLSEQLEDEAGGLGAGTKQRVSLGRALIREEVNIFLFDEAITTLEPHIRRDLRRKIIRINEQRGEPMIYVTHDQTEALSISEKVGVMKEGKLIERNPPKELYESPDNSFTGWFIGSPGMNLIPCLLKEKNGKAILKFGEVKYKTGITYKEVEEKVNGSEFELGIRPENIEISKEEKGHKFRITTSRYRKGRTIIEANKGSVDVIASEKGELSFNEGDEIYLTFPKGKVRIYEKESGHIVEPLHPAKKPKEDIKKRSI